GFWAGRLGLTPDACSPTIGSRSGGLAVSIRLALLFAAALCAAQAQSSFPPMAYAVDENWPVLPPGWNFGETPGVATDSRGHVYVLHRGPNPILEFAPEGRLVRSWGEGLYIRAHAVRIDPEGNIWTVDNDTHQVLK